MIAVLLLGLDRHEAHRRRTAASQMVFRVRRVVLLAPDERFDINRRNQSNFVAEGPDGASPVMGAPTGLHSDGAAWMLGQKSEDFIARKRLAERHRRRPRGRHALEGTALQRSRPMMLTFSMDALFIRGMRKHRHLGTLRCRQEGASTPSIRPRLSLSRQAHCVATVRAEVLDCRFRTETNLRSSA